MLDGVDVPDLLGVFEDGAVAREPAHRGDVQDGALRPLVFVAKKRIRAFLASVPAVEAFNGCYLILEHICKTVHPARRLLRAKASLDLERLAPAAHAFLAVGSDAHHPRELGFSVEIPSSPKNRREAFALLTTNTDISRLHFPRIDRLLPRIVFSGWTTLHEGMMRHELRRAEDTQKFPLVPAEEGPFDF